jgi:hypothetical protein
LKFIQQDKYNTVAQSPKIRNPNMKLNDMSNSRKVNAKKALKEHFEVNLNFNKLKLNETKTMLKKVRGLITETRTSKQSHGRYQNPAYMKLVMMEQALTDHYGDLRVQQRIMLENEEVQKGQVLLAAQEMVDSIQKMIVDVSKMKVEELPAVVTGVNNEIGTNQGKQFEQSVTQALGTLEQALAASKGALTSALEQISGGDGGEMSPDAFGGEDDLGGAGDMGDAGDMGGEELPDLDMGEPDMEEPEDDLGGAGRGLR